MKFIDGIDPHSPGRALAMALNDLEKRFGIALTIHDCRGMLNDSAGRPLFPGRNMHMHPYCIAGRFKQENWNRRCHQQCMVEAEAVASGAKRPFRHDCWKGVSELVVPIERDGTLILLIYAGGFRSPGAEIPDCIPPELRTIRSDMPEADDLLFEELARELLLFGQGIRHYLDLSHDRRGVPVGNADRIRRFLEDHAHEPVGLAELARWMNLSRSHACHLVKYHFGKPFHALLLEERLTRACNLLRTTEMPLKAVAAAVGFSNDFTSTGFSPANAAGPPASSAAGRKSKLNCNDQISFSSA